MQQLYININQERSIQLEKQYYLIAVPGCIDPEVKGPFVSEEEQDTAAKRIRKEQREEDALFWAIVEKDGELNVGAYSAGFFSE